jgi:DNA-binding MarR family transcriptional regulator
VTSCFDDVWRRNEQARSDESVPASVGLSAAHIEAARVIYKARRVRDRAFGRSDLFAEPAWDIMLTLLINWSKGRPTSVGEACVAACVPHSTALRWIQKLEIDDLVVRTGDPFDECRSYLRLSTEACGTLARALAIS